MVDAFREPGPEQKLQNEQDIGRDGEQVRLESPEAERPNIERKVVSRRCLRVMLALASA